MGERKVTIGRIEASRVQEVLPVSLPGYDRQRFEDVGFMTAMMNVLICNYAQTGHFGGPMSYTPANVALHLGGSELGALSYDIREPKHPYSDKFMLAGVDHLTPARDCRWPEPKPPRQHPGRCRSVPG